MNSVIPISEVIITGEVVMIRRRKPAGKKGFMFDNDTWGLIKEFIGLIDFNRCQDFKFNIDGSHSYMQRWLSETPITRCTFLQCYETTLYNRLKYYINQHKFKSVRIEENYFLSIKNLHRVPLSTYHDNVDMSVPLKAIYYAILPSIMSCKSAYRRYFKMPYRLN
jgi:hypothetical protein